MLIPSDKRFLFAVVIDENTSEAFDPDCLEGDAGGHDVTSPSMRREPLEQTEKWELGARMGFLWSKIT